MKQAKNQKPIIRNCYKSLNERKYIYLTEAEFAALDEETILLILEEFSGKSLIRLPESEIQFFEWLKICDFDVWKDLWQEDSENIYVVSATLLPVFMNLDGRGLPICDLQTTDNYFFTIDNMVDEESKIVIEVAQELFKKNKKLTIAQLLALEISIDPIDIWHFAYKYKLDLEVAKEAVRTLVEDNVLVHLTEAEHIAPFVLF
ncbi:hypothetical protein SDC9_94174 [bioreactor metagenome]|uniref:Uncharacterized protein n=1 Tax=bioreactor metagenome TaxID=1076179 RepID=A0A645ACQ8_9ZZZZ